MSNGNSKNNFESETINNFLDEDEKFQEFLAVKRLKPSTIKSYEVTLRKYCIAIELSPSEFIKEAEDEEDQGIKLKRRKIKSHIIKYIQYLRSRGLKETSISNYLIYVRSFYTTFEVELPKSPIKLNSLPKKDYKEWINKNDIKKAIKYANHKYKAIIILMTSSGMGSAEIRSLTFENFLKSLEEYIKIPFKSPYSVEEIRNSLPTNQHIIPTWHIQRIKTGEYYYTFSSPESVEAILDYLEYREAKNKPILGVKEPLFIGRRPGDLLNKYTMTSAFQKINDDAGFEAVGNKRYFTSHELRRFFSDQAFKSGMQERDIKWLRGQKPRDTLNRYVKPDPQNLKIEYTEKLLPCVSLEPVKILEIEENAYRRLRELEKEKTEMGEHVAYLTDLVEMIIDPKTKKTKEFLEGRGEILEKIKELKKD